MIHAALSARPCHCNQRRCHLCKLVELPEYQVLWGLMPKREVRCIHLGVRTEFRAGCNGMKCLHRCDLKLPAVPGVYCQTCPKYEEDSGAWV